MGPCPPQGTTAIPAGVGLCHPHSTLQLLSAWCSYACTHICKGVGDVWPSLPHWPCAQGLSPAGCMGHTLSRSLHTQAPRSPASLTHMWMHHSLLQNSTEQNTCEGPGSRELGTQLQAGQAGWMGTRGPLEGAIHARPWGLRGQSRLASTLDGDSRSKAPVGSEVSGKRCWKARPPSTVLAWQRPGFAFLGKVQKHRAKALWTQAEAASDAMLGRGLAPAHPPCFVLTSGPRTRQHLPRSTTGPIRLAVTVAG